MTGAEQTSDDRRDGGTSATPSGPPDAPESGSPVASRSDDSEPGETRRDGPAGPAPTEESGTNLEDTDETKPLDPDPDRATVQAATAGDEAAFESLIDKYQNRIYTRIYFMVFDRQIAEDLTQEAFFRTYLGLDSFRYEAKFSTWLTRIAINVVLHHFERKRAQKRTARVFSIDAARDRPDSTGQTEIPDRTYLPDEWAVRNERQVAIVEAVAELPEDFRSALALRELQQLSYQEIAESLGLPIGTVKSKIFRARAILQEKLKGIL